MKSHISMILVLAALSGCSPAKQVEQTVVVQLTPWHTATAVAPVLTVTPEPQTVDPTPIPSPTPTPTIHIVTLGETISSIALRYGLDMNTLLAANPDIDPYSLIVGNQVVIPAGNEQTQIGVSIKPLDLDLSQPECSRTLEGGLWCFVLLTNPLDEAATNLAVTFKLMDSAGEEIASHTVPAVLNKLEPGDRNPAAFFFAGPLPNDTTVTASLASAFPVSESEKTFFSVDTGNPVVEIEGRLAKVAGEAITLADPSETVDVGVVALAYDDLGNLVGIRRAESRVTLEQGKGVNFNLYVYSTGSAINSVVIKAEALLVNQ